MIAPLSVSEFHDLEEMQLIFESEAAALAAQRADEAEMEEMQRLATCEYRVGDKQSYREFIHTNYRLHCLIAQSTRNRRLCEVMSNVHVRLMRFFYLGLPLDSYGPALVAEHIALVEAIRSRDDGEARRQATDHIRKAMDRSAQQLMSAIRFGEAAFDTSHTIQGMISTGRSARERSAFGIAQPLKSSFEFSEAIVVGHATDSFL